MAVPATVPPLHDQAFRLERDGEAVAAVQVACERCDWGARGREAAVLALEVDGRLSQHVVVGRASVEQRLLLGPLEAGEHRLSLTLDERRSARGVGAVRVASVTVQVVAPGEPDHEALAHAPILHTRPGSLARFSDAPLFAWVERFPAADGGRELRYTTIFSHEDGGTPIDRLMATWGRATDIELVYLVELDAQGGVRRAEYQGKDHVMKPFAGRREGQHPVLYVVTTNNMLSDRGEATPRTAMAPVPVNLDGVSREVVMDAQPWTYATSGQEVRREGLVREDARPGSRRIPDPRRFAYLEACGELEDATLAYELAVASGDGTRWFASDGRLARFRVARSGCFRAAVALPAGTSASAVQTLRLRAHTRLARRGEAPLPSGLGKARVDRVNLLFQLNPDDTPGASFFRWTEGAALRPGGPPLDLPLSSVDAAPCP